MESYNSFNVARQQVLEAAKLLNLDDATTEFLSTPQFETNFTLPVKMDSGETKYFRDLEFSTIMHVDLQRVEFDFIPKKQSIPSAHLLAG